MNGFVSFLLVLAFFAVARMLFGAFLLSSVTNVLDGDFLAPLFMQTRFGDIALGEDKKSLSKLAKRLRSISALPEDAPTNRVVHIGIIDGLPTPRESGQGASKPEIVIDFANTGDAAVVLIKTGAVVLKAENATPGHRAKIGVEGGGPFDLTNAPDGLLAGFRIDAFGAAAAQPRDYFDTSNPNGPFCTSVRQWAELYGARLGSMHIYVFRAPTRINVLQNRLSGSPEPKTSPTWTAGIECRDSIKANGTF